jgi:U3 small nucleolar RNA-associated protein 20
MKLFQKLPRKNFEAKAPRLLTVICDSLKSRESDARDLARSTLAKVAIEISLDFLPDVLRELTVTLKEGYQLHVRAATVQTILLELSGTYKPTIANDDGLRSQLPFDAAVPSLMDTILADLWGVAQERKDATDNQVRFVKEAGGAKSLHSLELISSMLFFDPKSNSEKTSVSSIHAVVFPLLDRLRADGLTSKTIRRIRDALSRVVQGLSRNPTFSPHAALPFVYATLAPFVSKEEIESTLDIVNDLESDYEDDGLKAITVSGAAKLDERKYTRGQPIKNLPVVEWRPSVIQASTTRIAAMQAKTRTEISDRRVLDGASAPKLTGSSRRKASTASKRGILNDDASSSAVVFALQVLHSCLRKGVNAHDPAMLDPFVPLLTTCFCQCREADIVLLSLRCLGSLLRTELPSIDRFAKALSAKTLDLLVSSGNNQELLQATFKMLTLLINFDRSSEESKPTGGSLKGGKALPLDAEQMQVLLSFLQASIVESDQHNPALALVKAITSRRFVSPEIYDLMKTLLEQSVRSPKPSLREQCNVIFVNFLLNYPMTENRLEQELKQIVLNLGYEHADGRLSAIALVNAVVDRLPDPVLVQRGQLFFLPLTLQIANDESKHCREAVAKCMSALLSRLPTESLQSFFDYTRRWSESDDRLLRRTSLLLYSIFVDSCETFVKRGDTIERLISTIGQLLIDEFGDWEVVYLALVCLEKMSPQSLLDKSDNVWKSIVGCMVHRHAWVQAASCRLVAKHLQGLDAVAFFDNDSATFLRVPGSLFQLARNFCRVLNRDEADFNDDEELSSLIAKALSWILKATNRYPDLCYSDDERAQDDDDGDRDPVWWLMRRLNNIAKPKGDKRRQAVFKCFAAFATSCMDIASNYLELMIEPIQRAERESLNELERPSLLNSAPIQNTVSDLAKEVLHLIEEQCESHEKFVQAYAEVKKRARDKKDQRKATESTEAAVDPKAAAQRKIKKKEQEQKRRKRRVEERRQGRGAVAKRRHLN